MMRRKLSVLGFYAPVSFFFPFRFLFHFFALFFGLVLCPGLETTGVASERPLAGPDLPPVGRSKFDVLLNETGGSVPYPFDKLLALIRAQIKTDVSKPLSVLMFPYGRSLQRFAAEPNFFRYPRIVVGVNEQSKAESDTLPIDLKSKLYIGYVETTGMLEVISYNEEAARFEFQVVANYRKNATPEVHYAPRSLCMTCHEFGVPIFPGEPWSETNDNALLARKIIEARGGVKTYFGEPIQLKDEKGRGFSLDAMRFDFGILRAGKMVYGASIVDKICGKHPKTRISCVATGMKVSFATKINYWPGPGWKLLESYGTYIDAFYGSHNTLEIPVPFLSDRDPVTNSDVFGRSPHPAIQNLNKDQARRLLTMMRSNIEKLPKIHDPKVSRLDKVKISRAQCHLPMKAAPIPHKPYCNSQYFLNVFTLRDLKRIQGWFSRDGKVDFRQIEAAIDQMAARAQKDGSAALAQPTMQRALLLAELRDQALTQALTQATGGLEPSKAAAPKAATQRCCEKSFSKKPKLMPGGLRASTLLDADLRKMALSCGNCHGLPGVEYPIQFMAAKNEAGIRARIIEHRSAILQCLEDKKAPMPPLSSREHAELDAATRSRLVTYLKNLKVLKKVTESSRSSNQ